MCCFEQQSGEVLYSFLCMKCNGVGGHYIFCLEKLQVGPFEMGTERTMMLWITVHAVRAFHLLSWFRITRPQYLPGRQVKKKRKKMLGAATVILNSFQYCISRKSKKSFFSPFPKSAQNLSGRVMRNKDKRWNGLIHPRVGYIRKSIIAGN